MTKLYQDSVLGAVVLQKSTRARRISLKVNAKRQITVTLPFFVPYSSGIQFLEANRQWAQGVLARIPERKTQEETEKLRALAREKLPPRLQELARMHGFTYNKVFIKNNSSNWGSCSAKNNINLNLKLVLLPGELADYVMLHELCHLVHMNHGPEFHALMESVCPGHREYSKQLRSCAKELL